jgi:hypothetical protein
MLKLEKPVRKPENLELQDLDAAQFTHIASCSGAKKLVLSSGQHLILMTICYTVSNRKI